MNHKNTAFSIEGGAPLTGVISAKGNKNSALPILAACVMVEGDVCLENVPRIEDVLSMIQLLESLGVSANWISESSITLNSARIIDGPIDPALAARIRGSVLLVAPLLYRLKSVTMPIPGGDKIGRRRLDTHLHALSAFGAEVCISETALNFQISEEGFRANEVWLDEASVTGTEQAIMAAVLAKGETVISNAASEPHVQDLCKFLALCGASIEGIGSNRLRIAGTTLRAGTSAFALSNDFMEECSLIAAAFATKGNIILEGHAWEEHHMMRLMLKKIGCELDKVGEKVVVDGRREMVIRLEADRQMPIIKSSVWPGFNTDLMSSLVVLAALAKGKVMFHETLFDNRFVWTDQLRRMGADITICDPHRIIVQGQTHLSPDIGGIRSPDIRAGMSLLIAALATPGMHTIENVYQIDRGYERIDERLRALGARIERVEY